MDLMALIGALGGGMYGSLLGALPAFILTGVIAAIGGILATAGVPGADFAINNIAFGSFFGPHIAFAGGVAASAYAANNKKALATGMDITTPINSIGDPVAICVGGVAGLCGFLLNYLYAVVIMIPTDTVALTVLTSGVLARFIFGSSGLTGKYDGTEKRQWVPTGNALLQTLVVGIAMGCLVGGVGQSLLSQDVSLSYYSIICFGIAALSLIFAQCGFGIPATHHIVLPAAAATAASGSWMAGLVVAIITSLFGDIVGRSLNTYTDTHIDPPATVICTTMLIVPVVFG